MANTIEERLAKIELELVRLRASVASSESKLGWIAAIDGMFKRDRAFDEAVKLGRQWRERENEKDAD